MQLSCDIKPLLSKTYHVQNICSMFSQILKLIPRTAFERLVKETKAEHQSKGLASWSQFVALLFCQLGRAIRCQRAAISAAIDAAHRPHRRKKFWTGHKMPGRLSALPRFIATSNCWCIYSAKSRNKPSLRTIFAPANLYRKDYFSIVYIGFDYGSKHLACSFDSRCLPWQRNSMRLGISTLLGEDP